MPNRLLTLAAARARVVHAAEPLIAKSGGTEIREVAEYIERRVVELTREAVEIFNSLELTE